MAGNVRRDEARGNWRARVRLHLVGYAHDSNNVRVFADLETTRDLDEIWREIDERNQGEMTFCHDAVAAGKRFPLTPPPDHPPWTCLNYSFRGIPDPAFRASR